jgi:hypothetical protein
VNLPAGRRADEDLFGECGGRVVATCRPGDLPALRELAGGVPIAPIGTVGGATVTARIGERDAAIAVMRARDAHEGAIPAALA